MILAVPITAVLKIQLDSIDHPASKFLVRLLVGGAGGADDGAMALQPAEDTIHSGAAGSSTLPLVERPLPLPASWRSRTLNDSRDGRSWSWDPSSFGDFSAKIRRLVQRPPDHNAP